LATSRTNKTKIMLVVGWRWSFIGNGLPMCDRNLFGIMKMFINLIAILFHECIICQHWSNSTFKFMKFIVVILLQWCYKISSWNGNRFWRALLVSYPKQLLNLNQVVNFPRSHLSYKEPVFKRLLNFISLLLLVWSVVLRQGRSNMNAFYGFIAMSCSFWKLMSYLLHLQLAGAGNFKNKSFAQICWCLTFHYPWVAAKIQKLHMG
jgi:hypothetical protein